MSEKKVKYMMTEKGSPRSYEQKNEVISEIVRLLAHAAQLVESVQYLYGAFFNDEYVGSPMNHALWKAENEIWGAVDEFDKITGQDEGMIQ